MKMSEKSLNFMETVCQKLDEDRHLTLIEYAQDCGITTRNAYILLMKAVGNDRKRYMQFLQRPYYSRKKNNTSAQTTNMPTGMSVNTKEEVRTLAEKKKISSADLIRLRKKGSTLDEAATQLGYDSVAEFMDYLEKTNLSQKARRGLLDELKSNEKRKDKKKKQQGNVNVSSNGTVKNQPSAEKTTSPSEISDVNIATEATDENSCVEIAKNSEEDGRTQKQKNDVETEKIAENANEQVKKLETEKKLYTEYLCSLKEDATLIATELTEVCNKEYTNSEGLEMVEFSWKLNEIFEKLSKLNTEVKENSNLLVKIEDELDSMKKVYVVVEEECDEHELSEYYGDVYFMSKWKVRDEAYKNIFNDMAMNPKADELSLREVKKLAKIASVVVDIRKNNKKEMVLIASEREKSLLAELGYIKY